MCAQARERFNRTIRKRHHNQRSREKAKRGMALSGDARRHLAIGAVMPYFVDAVRLHRPKVMTQDSARASHQKKFTPLGIVFTVAGVLLFAYFVRKAGVGQILEGIKKLGFGFVLIIAISSIRHIVRSLSWMLCFDGPDRLRFWDALRGRLMGDALGNMVGLAS